MTLSLLQVQDALARVKQLRADVPGVVAEAMQRELAELRPAAESLGQVASGTSQGGCPFCQRSCPNLALVLGCSRIQQHSPCWSCIQFGFGKPEAAVCRCTLSIILPIRPAAAIAPAEGGPLAAEAEQMRALLGDAMDKLPGLR